MANPHGRNCRHAAHHHGKRLAHGYRRIDVDAAGGGKSGDQLEMVGNGIEPAADHRHLGIDDTLGPVDQQALGRARRTGQHCDVGNARYQRQRRERERKCGDQRQAPMPARRDHGLSSDQRGSVRKVAQAAPS